MLPPMTFKFNLDMDMVLLGDHGGRAAEPLRFSKAPAPAPTCRFQIKHKVIARIFLAYNSKKRVHLHALRTHYKEAKGGLSHLPKLDTLARQGSPFHKRQNSA